MRHVIERLLQLRMLVHIVANFLQRLPGRLQTLLEFRLGLDLRFAQRHLHPAVSIHFAFARVSIGRKIMSLNLLITADCTPSDCDDGMQPNGFSASTMWQSL